MTILRIRSPRHIAAAAGLALALVLTAACANRQPGHTAAAATARTPKTTLAHAETGTLSVSGGYVPQPASPDVAAAYLSITNNGPRTVHLTGLRTDAAASVMPMTEISSNGVGHMANMTALSIAPHSTASFTPGHAHLMLMKPTRTLREGDLVGLTMTFSPAGLVRLTLPVVPSTGP